MNVQRLKLFTGGLLGVGAFISASIWAAVRLFPEKNINIGDYNRAMGVLFEGVRADEHIGAFLYVSWGDATTQGWEVQFSQSGICIKHAWDRQRLPRVRPLEKAEPQINFRNPDIYRGWGSYGWSCYQCWHDKADGITDDIWNSELYVCNWLLVGFCWSLFLSYIAFFTIRSLIHKRRELLVGFPIALRTRDN